MIKGRATIQLFDEKTGDVVREIHEENMITNAVDTILNPPDYIEIGIDSDNDRSFNMLRDLVGNIADTAFRGVIVCRDKIPEDGNNMMLPWTNEEIGHAGISNTSTDKSIGTYNANESGRIENGKGYRHVWDFASDRANGEIILEKSLPFVLVMESISCWLVTTTHAFPRQAVPSSSVTVWRLSISFELSPMYCPTSSTRNTT